MGNCQAIDAATLVIQHPSGKVEKLYWPVSASEIMKMNPGHYVALLISTTLCPTKPNENDKNSTTTTTNNTNNNDHGTGTVRLTRIKLLRPTDTLVLGQVYRLITTQEVMKGLWAKKQAKLKRNLNQSEAEMRVEIIGTGREKPGSGLVEKDSHNQVIKHERHRPRTVSSGIPSAIASRSRTWQPSLHSISEAGTPNLQQRKLPS
ncbi:D-ribose-binding periplasmic protein [Parasponia andersonii]|uniref:D-ribose-binding periplasmic protein n=1 Tax=Parasponia andersonii TaxID=3476 RepID=A0A2P5CJ45_PARAD|nr:D-ribose-binding periplasmic protein [Parasponia andersonii]